MSQALPSVSIIIVTWNALDLLKKYLPSVVQNSGQAQIIIADNHSDDESTLWVKQGFPDCTIVTHDNNYGYCGGNNRAVDAAEGDILLFLNNDVEVTENWLLPIQRSFLDEKTGAAQPKMLCYKEKSSFEYAGAAGGMIDYLGFPLCRGRLFDSLESDLGQYDEPATIFWASGAAMAIRKKLFVDLGGFDERFEFHMEEIDLCWRLQRSGYTVKYEPESVVYHLGGGSLPTGSPRKTYYNFRNNLLMLHKNMNNSELNKIISKKSMLDRLASFQMLLKGDFDQYNALKKAHKDAFNMIEQYDLKNESELPRPPLPELDGVLNCSVVVEYFLKRRKTFQDLC